MQAIVRSMASAASNPTPTPLTRGYAAVIRSAMARQTPVVTQADVARAIGVSPSTISRMLSGKLSIATENLEAMCNMLRLDLLEVTREAMELAAQENRQRILDEPVPRPLDIGVPTIPAHEPGRSRAAGARRTRRRHS